MTQPLLRDLIDIPESVGESDFVITTSGAADLAHYVVTDDLRENFGKALDRVGHAVQSGRSQAAFLHGSFGSGKSHFMTVLREILRHNPEARQIRGLPAVVAKADEWLTGKKILCLNFHMLDATSVEQAVLEGYQRQILALHPDAPIPAVHRSDEMLADAARFRAELGDEKFFAQLGSGGTPGASGGLASQVAAGAGWTAATYDAAAAALPGTPERDRLVSALTRVWFTGAVRSHEWLDLDSGLAVITRHAKDLGYDAMVLFLDELILWLSTKISNTEFVTSEGAKLNKLVESADAARPLPIVSFVARQRNLEEFLGPAVGGTERAVLADVMTSVQGRLGEIVLKDTDLAEITEKRLLKPRDEAAKATIDTAFAAVRENRSVWDILLLGEQYGEAGIGSDASTFRRLYPFSPALVATLVALSQALQRSRTAIRLMTELLVARRDTLQVNDLIGVAALFGPLVLEGELPDQPKLRQQFQAARETYRTKLRPLLLAQHGITEEGAAEHQAFNLDDKLVRTLLLGALVPEVPALHNLTAAKLHALNFGSISSPIPGYENQLVLGRLRRLSADVGGLHLSESPDPVVSIQLSEVDYDALLDLVPHAETSTSVLQQQIRDLVCDELGIQAGGTLGEERTYPRDWRGRRHQIQVMFANIRDAVNVPTATLENEGQSWRVVIDYPFDAGAGGRKDDEARIRRLRRGLRSVFWTPRFLSEEMLSRVTQLAKINYLLGTTGNGDRLTSLAADWAPADRTRGVQYLQQRRTQILDSLRSALKQAYGAAKPDPADVVDDGIPVLHTLEDGLQLGELVGGTLRAAFDNLTGRLLTFTYPGTPNLPDDERPIMPAELKKVLGYARQAAASEDHAAVVDRADEQAVRRICNPLKLGELQEHRYVLNSVTCWWSKHLTQSAARGGLTDRLPVHALRELLDDPQPRGFDRDLGNLILAVVAEEQQLAWYRHGSPTPVDAVRAIEADMELRRPALPDEDVWDRAKQRAGGLLGAVVAKWRSPANLFSAAKTIRDMGDHYRTDTAKLVTALTDRAEILGLDPSAPRLATANRVATLMDSFANEHDDVALFERVADADIGADSDDVSASVAITTASKLLAALNDSRWDLLTRVAGLAETSEPARAIIDNVRAAARCEQQAADLSAVLNAAYSDAVALLISTGSNHEPPKPTSPPPTPHPPAGTTGGAGNQRGSQEVRDEAELDAAVRAIRSGLAAGRSVRVSWEVL